MRTHPPSANLGPGTAIRAAAALVAWCMAVGNAAALPDGASGGPVPCEGEPFTLVAEPWEESVRLFAGGRIRVVHLDRFEPAGAASFLAILGPFGENVLEGRTCTIVPMGSWTVMKEMRGVLDGETLVITVPTRSMNADLDGLETTIRIAPSTGAVEAVEYPEFDPG